jgi:uncharacterized RDD family membrane protein YckC
VKSDLIRPIIFTVERMYPLNTPRIAESKWKEISRKVPHVPKLEDLQASTETYPARVVEFVRVVMEENVITNPKRPSEASEEPVAQLLPWNEHDQHGMYRYVGATVAGSLTRIDCHRCHGSKRLTCKDCGGNGESRCSHCGGSGQRECRSCGGKGEVTRGRTSRVVCTHARNNGRRDGCPSCDGTGYRSTTEEHVTEACTVCDGDGRVYCSYCDDGQVSCRTCGGSGEVSCPDCGPDGKIYSYVVRKVREQVAGQASLPVDGLPGLPGQVAFPLQALTIGGRLEAEPTRSRNVKWPPEEIAVRTDLFFERQAEAVITSLSDKVSGQLACQIVSGPKEAFAVLHALPADHGWSAAQQKQRYFLAAGGYVAGALALVGGLFAGLRSIQLTDSIGKLFPGLMAGSLVALVFAYMQDSNPARVFRMVTKERRCSAHGQMATLFCSSCKAELCPECVTGHSVCPSCGQVYTDAVEASVHDGRLLPAPTARFTTAAASPDSGHKAGFWRRVGALGIDYVVLSAATALVLLLPAPFSALGGLVPLAYFTILTARTGQTLGKRMLGLRVVTNAGQVPGYGRALGRFFAYGVSALPFGVGFLMPLVSDDKQTLHDMICGTRVVRI